MNFQAKWIVPSEEIGHVCPVFRTSWTAEKPIVKAQLIATALGTYEAKLNGKRVSDYVLAPGWTYYEKRLQYQTYDITPLLEAENELKITVARGWHSSQMPGWAVTKDRIRRAALPRALLAELHLTYADGSTAVIASDESWQWGRSEVLFSEIYDGEIVDATAETTQWSASSVLDWPYDILIPQEGEEIREIERVAVRSIFKTPAGETVVDFGQNLTGYVEFTVDANAGDAVHILHGEILDKNGNFYNDNYRSAKAEIRYTCRQGKQTWHPSLTYFGFRYLKLVDFPGDVQPEQFTAVVVCSNIRRTGYLRSSNQKLNQLFSNVFWSQKGNFLDVPTDCPQRDERLGWTGDAQVFVKTASYNFDVKRFFTKWLHDMAANQLPNGGVGQVIPNYLPGGDESAAWGDAVTICPWQIYLTYGDDTILKDQYDSMKKWVGYISNHSDDPYLWTGHWHYGDHLSLDFEVPTRKDLIASAFYARSTKLVVKAGKVLGEDVSSYEELYQNIVAAFRKKFPEYITQTEHVLAVHFRLAADLQRTADDLAALIVKDGTQFKTGFVGTPYLLHALSDFGHSDLAYSLLLREQYPSWLFSVNQGATTTWEHWDSLMENGDFWDAGMNSFNHYAYGSVADWVYEKAAGITVLEDHPGFEKVLFKPTPDPRLDWLEAGIDTVHGRVSSRWTHTPDGIRYEVETAVPAIIEIGEKRVEVQPGIYTFWDL